MPHGTLVDANNALQSRGWRRCIAKEDGLDCYNLEHDDFEMIHIKRDGNCLFHCLAQIAMERKLEEKCNPLQSPQTNQAVIRAKVASYFEMKDNVISCPTTFGNAFEALNDEIPWSCENLKAIRSGKGGRSAYGGTSEIAAFCVSYDLCAEIFCPETDCATGQQSLILNPGFPAEMLLNTLAWTQNGERQPGADHWQRVKHRQKAPLISVSPTSPLSSPLKQMLPSEIYSNWNAVSLL
jgi:hypothetical protein